MELVPVSHNLAAAATIGLEALDAIEKHHKVKQTTQQEELAKLKELEKPEAVLLNMIVPGVETLVIAKQQD
jgi:hexosaminidase